MNRPDEQFSVSSECFPNIGARGRRRRLLKGFVASVLGIALFSGLIVRRVSPAWLLLLIPFAAFAAVCFFQVKEQTCVVLAAKGLREQEDGSTVRIAGEWMVAIQRQARRVWMESVAATLIVTAVALLVAALRR